jgi:GntR family transcriptional repressor for pyruvate dehydrogenase complex
MVAERSPNGRSAAEEPAAALALAGVLRERILEHTRDGAHLGSEDQLVSQYRISRPTLRQAMRVLQAEGLVKVRRGNSGGYFAATPSVEVVTRSASGLLRRQGAGGEHFLESAGVLAPALAVLAATRGTAAARRDFAHYVTDAWRGRDDASFTEAIDIAVQVGRRLGQLVENPVLALFSDVLGDLLAAAGNQGRATLSAAELAAAPRDIRAGHAALARAVEAGDPAAAERAAILILRRP